jgi:hypothetical protein
MKKKFEKLFTLGVKVKQTRSRSYTQIGKYLKLVQSEHAIYQKKEHKKLRRLVKKLLQTDARLKSYGKKSAEI